MAFVVLHCANLGGFDEVVDCCKEAFPFFFGQYGNILEAPEHCRTSMTEKERPASRNNYTKGNAAAIAKRVGKPLGTDKKTEKKEAELRDQTGTVGKVTIDEKKNN